MIKYVRFLMVAFAMVFILASCGQTSKETETLQTKESDERSLAETLRQENTAPVEAWGNTNIEITEIGQIVEFGHYEQDGDTSNGMEPIEWEVLAAEGNQVLLISKYVLDAGAYDNASEHKSWDKCKLRKWLNDTFLNTAFTAEEQIMIPMVTLKNPGNKYCRLKDDVDTEDKVFALSVEEILKYYSFSYTDKSSSFSISEELFIEPTPYAISQGVYEETVDESTYVAFKEMGISQSSIGKKSAKWWLRTPGISSSACMVGKPGMVGEGCYVNYTLSGQHQDGCNGVRPAIYLYAKVSDDVQNKTRETQNNSQADNEAQTKFRLVDVTKDNKAEMHYEYDDRGLLVKLTDYDRSGITDYEYDEIGRLIKETHFGKKSGNVKEIHFYEYNEYDEMIKDSESKPSGEVEKYTEYTYSENGIASETLRNADGTIMWGYTYLYVNGRLERKSMFRYPEDKPSYESEYWTYEYDNAGNKIKESHYYSHDLDGGEDNFSGSRLYEYDDFGNITTEYSCAREDGSNAVLEYRYYYDQYDNLTQMIYYMKSGSVSFSRKYAYEEVPIK